MAWRLFMFIMSVCLSCRGSTIFTVSMTGTRDSGWGFPLAGSFTMKWSASWWTRWKKPCRPGGTDRTSWPCSDSVTTTRTSACPPTCTWREIVSNPPLPLFPPKINSWTNIVLQTFTQFQIFLLWIEIAVGLINTPEFLPVVFLYYIYTCI